VNCDPKNIGKHPRTPNGHRDATTDERQVRAWWRKWPLANVGLAMGKISGLVAIDVDPRSGGNESLAALFAEHGIFPETLEAATGGGGFHFLFRHPGVAFKNSASEIGKGLDVKTDGGYIVAAPSLHASGQRYAWRGEAEPVPMPEWLLALVLNQSAKPSGKAAAAGATPPRAAQASSMNGVLIPNGERNERLFRIACAHRGNGASREEIEAAVAEAYETRCEKQPPMRPDEFRKIATSAARYTPESKKRAARAQGATP
jgi:putative DNA primase/helicase